MSVVRREIFLSYGREPEVGVVLRERMNCSRSLPVSHHGYSIISMITFGEAICTVVGQV